MHGKPNDGPNIMVSTLFDGLGKEKRDLGRGGLGLKTVLLMPCKNACFWEYYIPGCNGLLKYI